MKNLSLNFAFLLCLSLNLYLINHKSFSIEEVELKGDLEWRYCPKDKPIKGNINFVKDTKIYHLPEGNSYERTNPEACFATEEEARENGFRRSLR